MKCPKCEWNGTKKDIYCEKCGKKLVKTSKTLGKKVKEKISTIPTNKKRKFIILCICIFVIIGILELFAYFNSPKFIATKYFKALIANDTKEIYEYLETSASTFVTENLLTEKIETLGAVSSYSVNNIQQSNNSAIVTFVYTLENSSREYVATVSLTKSSKNHYLIFDNWTINSGKLVENINIKLPKNSKVTIDSISLDNYLSSKYSNDYYDVYVIPTMIKGDYKIQITLESGIVSEDNISIESNTTYTLGNITLDDNLEESLSSKVINSLNNLYIAALNSKNFSEISSEYFYENSNLDDLESSYKSLKKHITNSMVDLKSINFTNADIESVILNNTGKLQIVLTVTYNYTSSYTNDSETIEYSGNDIDTKVVVLFDYSNEEYQIYDYSSLYVSYPVKK
ncbi:MAG: hypothetical protein ACK5HP_02780 [Bacilli bacterium]